MATSGTSTQLGRKLWAAFRDSASVLGVGRNAHPPPLPRPGVPPSPWNIYHSQTARWFSRQSQARASPKNVRHCTSGGLLLLAVSSSPSSASSVVTTCTAVADSAFSGSAIQKSKISHLARRLSAFHQSDRGRSCMAGKRAKSSKAEGQDHEGLKAPPVQAKPEAQLGGAYKSAAHQPTEPPLPEHHESLADSVYKYMHLPKMPHRPTKEELLAAASGFGERLKVRLKWFSIRSMRPWNADEWGAFVSWFLFGHLLWILVGTTTFFSLIILSINTIFAQGERCGHPPPCGKR